MAHPRDRRSYARAAAHPFQPLKPNAVLVERVASAVALAVLIASWAIVYVAIVPADPAAGRRTVHVVATQR